jgi:endonuclease III
MVKIIRVLFVVSKMSSAAGKRRGANATKKTSPKKIKTETEINDSETPVIEDTSPYFEKPEKNAKTPVKKSKKINTNDIEDIAIKLETWQPENWEATLNHIREMRKNSDAPVDSMGCDKCMDDSAPPEVLRFQSLVSLMLSSQTKDQVTFAAMEQLRKNEKGLSIDSVLEMSEEELGKLIYPVGFWRTKAKHIKATSKILKEQFNGDVPNTVELLCSLPGVGPKMAHLCMKTAWGIISGIGKCYILIMKT